MADPVDVMGDTLEGWTDGDGPLYRRLAAALHRAVEDGRLAAGSRLPPERRLAEQLSVSRSTVAAAMEQLESDGIVDRRQGSGTYVRAPARPPDEGRRELVGALDERALLSDLSGRAQAPVEFVAAAVECAPEVRTEALGLDETALRRATAGHGYIPLGIPRLRAAVADHLTDRGLATAPEQVMVTTGAVEAVLLAARLFVEPGDPVAVETPSYPGALDVLRSLDAHLLGVEVDANGVRPDRLADLLSRSLPRLVYLVPDFHNPTGAVLTGPRRRQVARLAAEFHVPVVEDLVQRELWFDAPPPAPIASTDPDAPVLTLGSMSKLFWGGLRIGWIRTDPATIERLGRIKTATNYGTPVIDQLVAARLLADAGTVAARRRRQLTVRLDRLEQALADRLPDWRWTRPTGGLVLWAQLPAPEADRLTRSAEGHGVAAVPGPTFGIGARTYRDRIRLPYVADPEIIADGVDRLAAAWEGLDQAPPPGQTTALVV